MKKIVAILIITLAVPMVAGAVSILAISGEPPVAPWGTITGTISNQTDLWIEFTNRYTKAEIMAFGFVIGGNRTRDVYVNESGSDSTGDGTFENPYLTVKYALSTNAIPSSGLTNKWAVFIAPGVYPEDNPIDGRPYVNVVAQGDTSSCRIQALNPSSPIFQAVEDTFFYGMSFWGSTNAPAISMTNAGISVVRHCTFVDCLEGFCMSNVNAIADLDNLSAFSATITMDKLICIKAGKATIKDPVIVGDSAVNYLLYLTGSNTVVDINNPVTASTNLGYGAWVADGAHVTMSAGRIDGGDVRGIDTAIVVSGGHLDLSAVVVVGAQTALKTEGSDELHAQGMTIGNCSTGMLFTGTTKCVLSGVSIIETDIHMVTEGSNVVITGSGVTMDENKLVIDPESTIRIAYMSTFEGDEGLNIIGELHVGTPEYPKESVFGEGDSTVRGMLVYNYDGSTYSNMSAQAASPSGSTFGFANTNAGTIMYLASTLERNGERLKHWGVKMSLDTGIDMGSGMVVYEYYTTNGTWETMQYMVTDSGGSYYPHARQVFSTNGSFQMRYEIDIADEWALSDMPGLGESNYWSRARIVTPIISSMQVEQLKFHTSRTEINSDGFVEYFGKGRPRGSLGWNAADIQPAVSVIANGDIFYSTNIAVGMKENRMNTGDQVAFHAAMPADMDTSSHVEFKLAVFPSTTEIMTNVIRYTYATPGSAVYNNSAAAPVEHPNERVITNVVSMTANAIAWIEADLEFPDAISRREGGFGDILVVGFESTTLSGNISVMVINGKYLKWCEGDHVDLD